MAIPDRLVLPADVVIQPISRLDPDLRSRINHEDGGYSVTWPRSRISSSVVDAATAALLESFRISSTIVDAVVAYSDRRGLDPRATLEDAYPVLARFIDDGLLVPAESPLVDSVTASLQPGDRIGDLEIVGCVHFMIDTEVYRARTADGNAVALKLARTNNDSGRWATIRHEASILDQLDGRINPRLVKVGDLEGRPFLAASWTTGVDVHHAASEARGLSGRGPLLRLVTNIVGAYAHLHAQGVLHGDVHPRNVLVGPAGTITLIDFGLAATVAPRMPSALIERGGIDFFLEPEVAAASLADRPPPSVSATGEQYALGALLYLLLTGAHTHAFSLDPREMLRQLSELPPVPFARHGIRDMPDVERLIARALAKHPQDRHASVPALNRAFLGLTPRGRVNPPVPVIAQKLLDDVLERVAAPGPAFTTGIPAPTASAMNGAAGIAYALMRVAEIRNDEKLIAAADLWSSAALRAIGSEQAFSNADLGIGPDLFGPGSFYHHASGVHCVDAMIGRARGDYPAQHNALDAFTTAVTASGRQIDVAFGRAGLLIGCCLASEGLPPEFDIRKLRTCGDNLQDSIWADLENQPPLTEAPRLRSLGAAHGWAGYLLALLQWSQVTATTPPHGIRERLDQLAGLAQPAGRGLIWPTEAGGPVAADAFAAGWCNGAAGYVPLWLLSYARFAEPRYLQLAQAAAWTAYEGPTTSHGDLCCGYGGRAYALLSLNRHDRDSAWLARAHTLADRAANLVRGRSLRAESLYNGEIGIALLAADLEAPQQSRLPLFETESSNPRPL
jgi:serine/threonine-protein kinase